MATKTDDCGRIFRSGSKENYADRERVYAGRTVPHQYIMWGVTYIKSYTSMGYAAEIIKGHTAVVDGVG